MITPPPATPSAPVTTTSTESVPTITLRTHSAPTGRVGVALRFTIAATDSAGAPLRYAATGLPAGLSVDARTGLVTGVPTRAGVAHVTLLITDGRGGSVAGQLSWGIVGSPSITSHQVRSSANRRTVLSLTVVGGSRAALIRNITVTPVGRSARFTANDGAVVVSAFSGTGRHLPASARVLRGSLVISVRAPDGGAARVRFTSPPLTLGSRSGATVGVIVKATDAAGVATRLQIQVRAH